MEGRVFCQNVHFQFLFDSANINNAYAYADYGPQKIAILSNEVWQIQDAPVPERLQCTLRALAVVPGAPQSLIVTQIKGPKPGIRLQDLHHLKFRQSWSTTNTPF